jgi:hypothetical protein
MITLCLILSASVFLLAQNNRDMQRRLDSSEDRHAEEIRGIRRQYKEEAHGEWEGYELNGGIHERRDRPVQSPEGTPTRAK